MSVVCLSFSGRVVIRSHITVILAINTIHEGPKSWSDALDGTLPFSRDDSHAACRAPGHRQPWVTESHGG